MPNNIDNAIQGLQDLRAAIFVETGDVHENDEQDEIDQMDKLKVIQGLINKVETKIREYADN